MVATESAIKPQIRPIRVLLVEDNENDALLMLAELKAHGYEPDWLRVETVDSLNNALEEQTWDIVFADYTLPRFSAPEALRTVRECGQDLPVIIVSGTVGEETAVQCMKAGAADFMLKGQLGRLIPAMERELREADERRYRRKTEAALAESASQLLRKVRQQEAVAELGIYVLSGPSLEELMTRAVHLAAATLEAEAARVVEYAPELSHPWIVRAVQGLNENLIGGSLPADTDAQALATVHAAEPVIVENIHTETRFPASSLHRVYGLVSSASVVIMGDHSTDENAENQRPFGFLQVDSSEASHFTGQDAWFLQSLANVVGVAAKRKQAEALVHIMLGKLELSNRELEHFATIASHDLQAPLRKVQLFCNFIRESAYQRLDGETQDYLDRMQRALQKMQNLIDDLLTLSRVSRKAKPFMPTDFNQVMTAVRENLLEDIRARGARLEIDPLPTLEADPGQMEVLFQNLVENGLKFQREGVPPVIRIAGEYKGDACEITVSDNGIGFQDIHAERIFEAFQRLHGESSTYSGSGIGLAICHRIVERHNGGIRAEGHPDQGARFIVRLPNRQK